MRIVCFSLLFFTDQILVFAFRLTEIESETAESTLPLGAYPVSGMKVGIITPLVDGGSPKHWAKWISQFLAPHE